MNVGSADEEMKKLLKFSERPSSRVRFRFGDGEWEETPGPEFLRKFRANTSGRCQVAWAAEAVKGEAGN
jgi:hypothetical protein